MKEGKTLVLEEGEILETDLLKFAEESPTIVQ
jgi:hypothetical protein